MEIITNSAQKDCIKLGIDPTPANINAQFIKALKKKIHIVLAFSPYGEQFRTRLRVFPSIISCCEFIFIIV